MKKLGFATLLFLASSFANAAAPAAVSPTATGAVINLGTIVGSTSTTVTTSTSPFSMFTSFTDTFNFTLGTNVASLSIGAIGLGGHGGTIQEFTDISMGSSTGVVGSFSLLGFNFETANYSMGSLAAGNYSFEISGITEEFEGGYDLTLMTSPVPEPSTIALMLGGLGLVGFMAARRRNQNA